MFQVFSGVSGVYQVSGISGLGVFWFRFLLKGFVVLGFRLQGFRVYVYRCRTLGFAGSEAFRGLELRSVRL